MKVLVALQGGPADGQTMMIEANKTIIEVAGTTTVPPKITDPDSPSDAYFERLIYKQSTGNPLIFIYEELNPSEK